MFGFWFFFLLDICNFSKIEFVVIICKDVVIFVFMFLGVVIELVSFFIVWYVFILIRGELSKGKIWLICKIW